jgi:hypothetical protein
MFSFKNVSAAAFFLYGTTFLWMTASFVGRTPPPKGPLWTVVNVCCFAAIVGFTAAAWGVFKLTPWWEPVAAIAAVIGLVALVAYVVAIRAEEQPSDVGVAINIVMHAVCSVIVLVVASVPTVRDWFEVRWA